MPLPSSSIPSADEDLRHCRRLLAAGSKSFSLASRLLPQAVRDRTTILYAFCRVVDDAVDGDCADEVDEDSAAPASSEITLRAIHAMRERLRLAYEGSGSSFGRDPVERSFARLLEDTPIPRALPEAFLEGMEWDAHHRRYESLDDLNAYATRVAGTVGAMMTIIMMHHHGEGEDSSLQPSAIMQNEILRRACDLGVAMQLSNIARDVGEDARRGRVYLPLRWMHNADINVDTWLHDPKPTDAVRELVRRLLLEAHVVYRRADSGIALLPRSCQLGIRTARLVYSDLARSIESANFDSITGRAVVPLWRKLWLVGLAAGMTTTTTTTTPSTKEVSRDLSSPAIRALVDACFSESERSTTTTTTTMAAPRTAATARSPS